MSTMVSVPQPVTAAPLHLSGNITEQQNQTIKGVLHASIDEAYQQAIEFLDQQSAQSVIETELRLRSEMIEAAVDIIRRHTASDKFLDEQVPSNRVYPPSYRVRPIEAQVTELRKYFPKLGSCWERLARRPLPEGAEGWFAIPRWQALAPTYNEAVEMMVGALASKRRFQNRIASKLGPKYLRQLERSVLAEKVLEEQQQGNEILVAGAQMGMRHRGCSARRARWRQAGNEFAAGAFFVATVLLTHPERLSTEETLMIDCGGDEYSLNGDYHWDRVPLFDFDISGIEFSIFYEDRSRDLWGMPSAFLCKMDVPTPAAR